MSTRWKGIVWTLAGCAAVAVACDSGPQEPIDNGDLPGADASALWTYLQDEGYRDNWTTWPGKGEYYEWEGTFHPALLTTYVNDAALGAVGAQSMPNGAIIVKENFAADSTLESITTMYKIEGFDPSRGDWFWARHAPSGQVEAGGSVGECIGCHQGAADADYVFGNMN